MSRLELPSPADGTSAGAHSPRAYRADIDGLRAVAVLSVVIYHLSRTALPGGYVGVDIFFVISGYLITQNIWGEMADGRFTMAGFYLRRIRRILPAFLVMVMATLAAACLLMVPEDLERLSRASLWSAVSLSNVFFWLHLDTGYFAASSEQEPLLHTWSLGVEEQFYLVWPVLLLLAWRLKLHRSGAIATAALICVASFVLGEWIHATSPKFAYYMLPARAGELMVGALLALAVRRDAPLQASGGRMVRVGDELAGLAGFGFIVWSLLALDENSTFPGFNAIYPCLGAALVIWAGGRGARVVTLPLGWRPMVWVGLISYSLYLWHWPILAFLRYFLGELDLASGSAAVVAMFALAWLSYRWVEQPARHWRAAPRRQALALFVLPVGALCLVAAALAGSQGLKRQFESGTGQGEALTRLRTQVAPAFEYRYNCQLSEHSPDILRDPRCLVGAPAARKAGAAPEYLLWGDSQAAHFIGLLGQLAKDGGYLYRNASHSACPPVFGGDYGVGMYEEGCRQFRPYIRQALLSGAFDTVVISGGWDVYDAYPGFRADLERTLAELTAAGVRVVIVGQVPRFRRYDRSCELRALRLPGGIDCRARARLRDRGETRINRHLAALAASMPGVEYLGTRQMLCRRGSCSPYLGQRPVYFDNGHLSMSGSWYLGRRLVARPEGQAWQAALRGTPPAQP
ncbi:acyltransferase family protein [Arenimonas daejeonensis]|uniref:acyltransferase family protein n=1 Tax=Arenimonas daejeonensis TaxID=370777 RepID=UPI0011BF917D|nr:acyltransferase family protein [Arenimonas daejeonensis]